MEGMTAGQRQKASDACFKLATYACSTSTDGTLTVASTPGAGKNRMHRDAIGAVTILAHIGLQAVHIIQTVATYRKTV